MFFSALKISIFLRQIIPEVGRLGKKVSSLVFDILSLQYL